MIELDLDAINQEFEYASPTDILAWACTRFSPRIAATSSFQSQSMPLLHMIAAITPEMPVFFLDTGFHFPETLEFRDQLTREWGLRIVNLTSEIGHAGFGRQYGQLHSSNPDLCCYINKVEPLRKAKYGLDAWITGIRRDQTAIRRDAAIVSRHLQSSHESLLTGIPVGRQWTDHAENHPHFPSLDGHLRTLRDPAIAGRAIPDRRR